MDFLVSKLVEHLLLPSNLIGFVGVLGLTSLLIGWRRLGRSLLTISLVALLLAGWSPLGTLALKILEDRFPTPRVEGPVSGIIMLGGAVNTHITKDRGAAALNDAGERITAVAALARKHPDARILLSGGASDLTAAEPVTESAIAKDQLRALGVAADRIELEEGSRTTCENAEQSAVVGKPKDGQTWLLVTSASHMPRAVACFRAVGFSVVPFPVDYRTLDARWPAVSVATGLQMLDLAAHEWIGLVGYRVLARTEELFPTP
jgi:uncharacterized SAM-binding protein YcdF (DUF218 family)